MDWYNGNILWIYTYYKEMNNNVISFKAVKPGEGAPRGYKNIDVSLIWDVKIYFTREAQLVANVNLTYAPPSTTYTLVV